MTATKSIANPQGGNKGFVLAVVAIVVIGVALVAILATGRDSKIDNQTGPVTIEGDALPSYESSGVSTPADTATGLVAPDLTGETFDGGSLTIGNDGRPKAVFFLAHWCPHCQVEVPKVQALIDAGQVPEGIDLYGVSTALDASRGNFPPETWFDTEGWTVPTLKDSDTSEALAAFGGASFPYVLYLDAENKVVARSTGEVEDAVILALMDQAIAGSAPADATE